MGTNYYAIKKMSDEDAEKAYKAIEDRDIDALKAVIPLYIHLGKSSIGWQFVFNHNGRKHYSLTRESINDFLKDCKISTEYGEEVSLEDFWKLVDSKSEGLTSKTYYENWDKYHPGIAKPVFRSQDILSDDLIFSNSTKFS